MKIFGERGGREIFLREISVSIVPLSRSIHVYVSLWVCICLVVFHYICVFQCFSISYWVSVGVCLSVIASRRLSFYLSVCLCVCVCVVMSVCLCVFVCVCMSGCVWVRSLVNLSLWVPVHISFFFLPLRHFCIDTLSAH